MEIEMPVKIEACQAENCDYIEFCLLVQDNHIIDLLLTLISDLPDIFVLFCCQFQTFLEFSSTAFPEGWNL